MNKSFMLGGKKFRVEICKDKNTTFLGKAYSPEGRIVIWDNWEGSTLPEDSQEQTLYHELMHCILNEIGRCDLSDDEQLVQSIAVLMHQFHKTAK